MATVAHPRIRPGVLEDREYQRTIAAVALRRPTLVVLPTGLGKTAIALRVAADCLLERPDRSILFLAPTRPLVVQHGRTLAETLFAPPPVVWTGQVAPAIRAAPAPPPRVIVATPQVVAHDLADGRLDLAEFSLVVFDEAHRAVGEYPYVAIGHAARERPELRRLAMTASPGSSIDRIRRVWTNLGLQHFEYRTIDDLDVRSYLHGTGVETQEVPVPPALREIAVRLRTAVLRQVDLLARQGLLSAGDTSRRSILQVGELLHRTIAEARREGRPVEPRVWSATTAQAVAMKTLHALELAESQGVESLRRFLDRQVPGPGGGRTPAQRVFREDPEVARVYDVVHGLDLEHPKVAAAVELVRSTLSASPNARVLLFTQYRSTADVLVEALRPLAVQGIRAERFVGQASREGDKGLSQREQIALLDRFRAGEVNCLVATSVAEEGLDIPSTDLVVFYEPIPDIVRTIQRRGRTGRGAVGRVVILVAAGTRDVGLDRSSRGREQRMHTMLERLEAESTSGTVAPAARQKSLSEFAAAPR